MAKKARRTIASGEAMFDAPLVLPVGVVVGAVLVVDEWLDVLEAEEDPNSISKSSPSDLRISLTTASLARGSSGRSARSAGGGR